MFLDFAVTYSSLIFASFAFQCFFRTTWISSTLVKGTIPFFLSMFIYKLNRATIFSAEKGRVVYDYHSLECIIYT